MAPGAHSHLVSPKVAAEHALPKNFPDRFSGNNSCSLNFTACEEFFGN
jgi:hypothetical protein